MEVKVRGKNKYEPPVKEKEYIDNKLQKLNQFFNDTDDLCASVLCKVYDTYQTVEITIPTKNIILRAEVKADTIYAAVDQAIDKLESQIKKHKSKIYKSLKQREGVAAYYTTKADFDLKKMETDILVSNLVKSKSIELEPMTMDDAIVQMEMLGHDFYVFLDKEIHKTCVVYLREDGNYGVIRTK